MLLPLDQLRKTDESYCTKWAIYEKFEGSQVCISQSRVGSHPLWLTIQSLEFEEVQIALNLNLKHFNYIFYASLYKCH